jgi:hypothetical protein
MRALTQICGNVSHWVTVVHGSLSWRTFPWINSRVLMGHPNSRYSLCSPHFTLLTLTPVPLVFKSPVDEPQKRLQLDQTRLLCNQTAGCSCTDSHAAVAVAGLQEFSWTTKEWVKPVQTNCNPTLGLSVGFPSHDHVTARLVV